MFEERRQSRVEAQRREGMLVWLLAGALLLSLGATLVLLADSWWRTAGESIGTALFAR